MKIVVFQLRDDEKEVIETVKKELMFFIENEVPLVKFVDRTFNADRERARESLEKIYLKEMLFWR